MKKYLFCNLKNYLNSVQIREYIASLRTITVPDSVELVVLPPINMLSEVAQTEFALGAQHAIAGELGAATGETPVAQLAELGVRYCLVGHSEQRLLFGQTESAMRDLIASLIEVGITPILCVGEDKDQYDAGQTLAVLREQIDAVLTPEQYGAVMIAYEPIWAISGFGGTEVASLEQIETAMAEIQSICAGVEIPVLYGGSVNAQLDAAYFNAAAIHGFLVGRASTKIDEVKTILDKFEMA